MAAMARNARVRVTDGAPEPALNEKTVWIGKQPDEAEAKPAKSKTA